MRINTRRSSSFVVAALMALILSACSNNPGGTGPTPTGSLSVSVSQNNVDVGLTANVTVTATATGDLDLSGGCNWSGAGTYGNMTSSKTACTATLAPSIGNNQTISVTGGGKSATASITAFQTFPFTGTYIRIGAMAFPENRNSTNVYVRLFQAVTNGNITTFVTVTEWTGFGPTAKDSDKYVLGTVRLPPGEYLESISDPALAGGTKWQMLMMNVSAVNSSRQFTSDLGPVTYGAFTVSANGGI